MPTLTEIAAHLGVTQPRASQLKKQGMPLNSLRAAKLWRDKQAKKRESTNAKTANVQSKKKGRPRTASKPSNTGDSLEDSLRDAITVAKDAFTAYQDALRVESSSTSARLSEFNKALQGRQNAEKLYREEMERRGLLVQKSVVVERCRRVLDSVMRLIRKLPNESGPLCNQSEPLVAVGVLNQARDEILTAAQNAFHDLQQS